jgi:hypothetical protein
MYIEQLIERCTRVIEAHDKARRKGNAPGEQSQQER